MLKVNWDVAIAQGENRMGVGIIIRDEKGNVIAATSKPVMDEMLGIVKVLRQKFPIHDRLMKMEVKMASPGVRGRKKHRGEER
jgi:hypothetical protein